MTGGRNREKEKKGYQNRRSDLNVGCCLFGFIAIYLISLYLYVFYFSPYLRYEVIEGNLATDYHYTGIALRTEQVYSAEKAGYINYYASEK